MNRNSKVNLISVYIITYHGKGMFAWRLMDLGGMYS